MAKQMDISGVCFCGPFLRKIYKSFGKKAVIPMLQTHATDKALQPNVEIVTSLNKRQIYCLFSTPLTFKKTVFILFHVCEFNNHVH